jgi:hypothetical protein
MECNLRLIVMRLLSLEKCIYIYMRVRSIFHVVLFIDALLWHSACLLEGRTSNKEEWNGF